MDKEQLEKQLKCLTNLTEIAIDDESRELLKKYKDQVEYQLKQFNTTED